MDVIKVNCCIPVSPEALDYQLPPFDQMLAMMEEQERAFRALPSEEQERIKTERKAAYEARRCQHCGCHPDEHGDY